MQTGIVRGGGGESGEEMVLFARREREKELRRREVGEIEEYIKGEGEVDCLGGERERDEKARRHASIDEYIEADAGTKGEVDCLEGARELRRREVQEIVEYIEAKGRTEGDADCEMETRRRKLRRREEEGGTSMYKLPVTQPRHIPPHL